MIAALIQIVVPISVSAMPHLRGLKLAHPVTSNKTFTISLLIGTDYYWEFVQDTIIIRDDPVTQESKLSFIRAIALLTPTGNNLRFTTDNIHSNT